jgi:hypothetical protein
MMEAGEFENRKAFEEVVTSNVRTGIDYSKETRRLFRELEMKLDNLDGMIRTQNTVIEGLRLQLAGVQAELFRGGTG